MKVAWRTHDGITIVAPEGRVDSPGAVDMASVLEARVSSHYHRLVVDMAEVCFIGSKGLHALVRALSACRSLGGDLKLAGVGPNVLYILKMIKFDELFSVCANVHDAIAEFGGAAEHHDAVIH